MNLALNEKLDPVNASEKQLIQLLEYLCTNASEAIEETERKTGQITISTYQTLYSQEELDNAFFEHTLEPGNVVILEIRDDGIGMSEEVRERLFSPPSSLVEGWACQQSRVLSGGMAPVCSLIPRQAWAL